MSTALLLQRRQTLVTFPGENVEAAVLPRYSFLSTCSASWAAQQPTATATMLLQSTAMDCCENCMDGRCWLLPNAGVVQHVPTVFTELGCLERDTNSDQDREGWKWLECRSPMAHYRAPRHHGRKQQVYTSLREWVCNVRSCICWLCTHKAIQTRPCPPASHPEHPRWCQYLLPSTHETWWAGACNTLTVDGSRGWGGTESGLRVKHYCTSEVTKGHATVKPAPAAYQDQI